MSTKRLARELGLIRQRSQPSGGEKKPGSKQLFSYLIVIDFESTCWREKNNYGQEIIEFPAVLMNTTSGEIESEFHSYVQPQEHPVLSAFCTELTGITQTQVEAGVPLRICLSRFVRWLHQLQHEKGMVFVTDSKHSVPSAHLCAFVTWSDWDLGVCLLYECKRKQINKPGVLNSWIDLRATYKGFYSRKPKGLNGALQDLGIEFSGREHSGLDDARNTARLAWRMIMDCCVMKITKSLSRPQLKSSPLYGDVNVHNGASDKREKQPLPSANRTSNSSSSTTPVTACQSLVSPRTMLTSFTMPVCVNTPQLGLTLHHSTSNMSPDPETPGCNWPEGFLSAEVGESGSYDDVLLEDEANVTGDQSHARIISRDPLPLSTDRPHPSRPASTFAPPLPLLDPYKSLIYRGLPTTTFPRIPLAIYMDRSNQSFERSRASVRGLFHVPSSLLSSTVNKSTNISCSVNQSSHYVCSHMQSALSSCSVNQSALSNHSVKQLSSSSCSNQLALSSSSNKWLSLPPHRGRAKITSPLCDCGRRAKHLTVCNGGPNHGRAFYSCTVRKNNAAGPTPHNGCGFFKWESALIESSLGQTSMSVSSTLTRAASRTFR
ncbi:ERI1 exoribonuclease 2 [Electrophorus electricus]|uniref:ERI1 exoribonuclease 2 n=1 Tax=Electrophorus electricus TaxID=8005 RepID=UPI0015D086BD|nr:ERI1 exoribonuclease 2 [Electrophorus electricus]